MESSFWNVTSVKSNFSKYITLISRHMTPHCTITTVTNMLLQMTANMFNICYLVTSASVCERDEIKVLTASNRWTWCFLMRRWILASWTSYFQSAPKDIFLSPSLLISCCLIYHIQLPFPRSGDVCVTSGVCLQVSSRVERRLQELEREMHTERRPEQRAAMSDEPQEVTLSSSLLVHPTPPCWHSHVLSLSKGTLKNNQHEGTEFTRGIVDRET